MTDKKRGWPSRQLQAAIFVVLLAAAAYQVWGPVGDPRARAEQLYADAWFAASTAPGDAGRGSARRKIETALKLDPANPRYEQALVWFTDPERLPALLKGGPLGPEARALGAGILYQQALQAAMSRPAGSLPPWWEDPAILAALDALMAADPGNSLPHYLKAQMLARAGRTEEALAEVRAGNDLPRLRHVVPEVSAAVQNPVVIAAITSSVFPVQARLRYVARFLSDAANLRLRQRRVDGAREILEACCRMGVQVAGAEPRTVVSFLVGQAVYAIGWDGLEPLLKDFGPRESLERHRKVSQAFEAAQKEVSDYADSAQSMSRLIALVVGPGYVAIAALASLVLLILALVGWLVTARAARHSEPVATPAWDWGEGWLARVCLAAYAAFGLVLAGLLFALVTRADVAEAFATPYSLLPAAAAPLALLVLVIRLLRRRYCEESGVRLSYVSFLWRSPAPVRAWFHRRLSAALGYQVLFVLGLVALTVSLYKPFVGIHPWQIQRVSLGSMSEESNLVSRCLAPIRDAARDRQASLRGPR